MALFVGVGIDTFYEKPEKPKYSGSSTPVRTTLDKTTQTVGVSKEEYQKKNEEYREGIKVYNRNVSIVAIVASVMVVAISLLLLTVPVVIADGLLLGGMGTLLYGLIMGFQGDSNIFRFVVVSMGLAIVLFVSYFRFLKKKS